MRVENNGRSYNFVKLIIKSSAYRMFESKLELPGGFLPTAEIFI